MRFESAIMIALTITSLILLPAARITAQGDNRPFHLTNPESRAAVLLLHGLTGSPWEVSRLGEFLHDKGLTVRGIRLPGHGTRVEDLEGVGREHWIAAALEAFDALKETTPRVYVVGLSMGGLLALHLAENRDPAGTVLVAPALKLRERMAILVPIVKFFKRYRERRVEPQYSPFTYEKIPLESVHELLKLSKEVRAGVDKISSPVLIMQSKRDPTVDPDGARELFSRLGVRVKELMWFNSQSHVLITEENPEVDRVLEAIYNFLAKQEANSDGR